jgi:hypothetical protein
MMASPAAERNLPFRVKKENPLRRKSRIWPLIAVWIFVMPLIPGGSSAQLSGITVLNPQGQPPVITRIPMAPRLDSLNGKTIYIVDIGFTDTHQLLTEMRKLLAARYPDTTWVVRTKKGTYFDDDPELWKEIREKGHGMIMGTGH